MSLKPCYSRPVYYARHLRNMYRLNDFLGRNLLKSNKVGDQDSQFSDDRSISVALTSSIGIRRVTSPTRCCWIILRSLRATMSLLDMSKSRLRRPSSPVNSVMNFRESTVDLQPLDPLVDSSEESHQNETITVSTQTPQWQAQMSSGIDTVSPKRAFSLLPSILIKPEVSHQIDDSLLLE
jgi:hypothetical protein